MDKQQQVLDWIDKGENCLITGSAGVGKTYIMRQVITPDTLVAAPTGIAALNIGGVTCHRAFKLPIGLITDRDYNLNSELRDVLRATKRLIIDEIGMIRADVLDLIEWKCKRAKGNDKPFGGIQVILVGDFYQLEPIIHNSEKEYFFDDYSTPFCFGANCFKDFKVIELTKVYRQDNKRQVKMLNSIRRKDKWYKHAISYINKESLPYDQTNETLHLCCYKKDAERINAYWYNQINSAEKTYRAHKSGAWKENEQPVPEVIKLKVGTRVIIAANDVDGTYVNGDKGTIYSMGFDKVVVRKDNGQEVVVAYNTWEKYGYSGAKGSLEKYTEAEYSQLPIKLGWAVTVHASQGLTLDKIAIHTGRGCFSHGQAYVALSRAKDLTNISFVQPLEYREVIVKNDVIQFYEGINEK